jgi:hypothetical protein
MVNIYSGGGGEYALHKLSIEDSSKDSSHEEGCLYLFLERQY